MTATTNTEIQALQSALKASLTYFEKTTSVLIEEHSSLKPNESAFTAAQQIAHVALSTDWFMDGAFRKADGFNMDFEADLLVIKTFTSVDAAKAMVRDSYTTAIALLAEQSMETLRINGMRRPASGSGYLEGTLNN